MSLLALVASAAIYVSPAEGFGWWLAPKAIRPSGQSIGRVDIAAINAAREPDGSKICRADGVHQGMFRSADRAVQAEIEATWRTAGWGAFSQRFTPAGGPPMLVQVGIIETCDDTPSEGFALVVTRTDTNQVVHYDEFGHENGTKGEGMVLALYPVEGGKVGYRGCFECGDATTLHYDVTRRRVYAEYDGH